jgi:hypothetical protein
MTLEAQPAFDSDEWLSRQDDDAGKEFAAINLFCRALLLGTLAIGLVFILAVTYLALVHA